MKHSKYTIVQRNAQIQLLLQHIIEKGLIETIEQRNHEFTLS